MPHVRPPRHLFAAAALTVFAVSAPFNALADEPALFASYDADSKIVIETAPYEEIIRALSVPEKGRTLVAYDVAHAQALPFFSQYVDYLAGVPVAELNRDEQLAFWLNTRNVLLVQALAEDGRVRGFKKKRGTPQNPGKLWREPVINIGGVSLSLHDIEQDILFAGWDDPNIMFGLYQGFRGGPTLPREPFTGANVRSELAEAGRRFTSETRNFRIRGDKVRLTSYFDWYLPLAFDGDEGALRAHLAGFARPDDQTVVRTSGQLSRRKLSTEFEQYTTRQASSGVSSSGSRPVGGFGS